MLLRAITNLFFKDPKGPAPLTTKEYLAQFESDASQKPESGEQGPVFKEAEPFKYLKDLRKYLEGEPQSCPDNALLLAIRAAKKSIDEGHSEEEVFEFLVWNMLGISDYPEKLERQDKQGNTALHYLILLGDKWLSSVEVLLTIHPKLRDIKNSKGIFPAGLAADMGACELFIALVKGVELKSEVIMQFLKKPEDRKKYKDYTATEMAKMAANNPDPTIFKATYLIVANEDWQKAYNNITVFHEMSGDNLEGFFKESPEGFSDDKTASYVWQGVDKMPIEDLKRQSDDKLGNTKLHTAFAKKAEIATAIILGKLAAADLSSPATGVEEALKMKNKEGNTPENTAAGLTEFVQKIKKEYIPQMLSEFANNRPNP